MSVQFFCVVLLTVATVAVADETSDSGSEVKFGDCLFHRHTGLHPAINRLERLKGITFTASDSLAKKDGYTYQIGICTPADDQLAQGQGESDGNVPYKEAAVLQRRKNDQSEKPFHVLGRLTKADVLAGCKPDKRETLNFHGYHPPLSNFWANPWSFLTANWINLEYDGGDRYGSHCQQSDRRTVIMILCDRKQKEGVARVIEENTNKTSSCYYLFEFEHEAACLDYEPSGLSVGSILIIIFLAVVGVYLLGGFIYQRFIVGAKGMEQIPNLAFWQDFGNLQADGCNLVCRSGSHTESKQYRGIGDDQLQTAPEEEEDDRDDHLLPM